MSPCHGDCDPCQAQQKFGKSLRSTREMCVVDASAGKFQGAVKNHVPTILCSRAHKSFYLPALRRFLTLQEVALQQGVETDVLEVFLGTGLAERKLAECMGNAVSINLLERVLPDLLRAAGLTGDRPVDVWALAHTQAVQEKDVDVDSEREGPIRESHFASILRQTRAKYNRCIRFKSL